MIAHAGKDVKQGKHSSTDGGSANLCSHFGNQYGGFTEIWESIYLKTQLYTLSIYIKDTPSYHKDTCSTMVIAALFVIARNWK